MKQMSKFPAHWFGKDESPLPPGCGESFDESIARMDAMKMSIWNAEKHRVRACKYCGERLIMLQKRKKNRKTMYTNVWVSIEPTAPGRALPFHRYFNGFRGRLKHREHHCHEKVASVRTFVGASPDPRDKQR
jgi:hypothetical protein